MTDFSSASVPPVSSAEKVSEAVQDLQSAAGAAAREFGQAAGEKLHEFKDSAGRVVGESRDQWKEFSDQAMAYVKENPGKSVLAGLGAGFIIGLLFRDN